MTPLYLAVDAGNTKTLAGVATADGELVGLARGGIGDIYGPGGPEAAQAVVLGVVAESLHTAGARASDVRHAAFLLAGVDWPDDERYWNAVLGPALNGSTFTVRNDGFALLRCGRLDGQGVSVVLGTGAALAGRGPVKERALSWWMQHPLGAAGLVSEAMRAVFLAELGLGAPTKLTDVLPRLFGASSPDALLEATTKRGHDFTHSSLASRAPGVMVLADEDPVVADLVRTQAARVADYALTLTHACGLDRTGEPVTVVAGGGLIRERDSSLFAEIDRELHGRGIDVDLRHSSESALVGALLDALAEGGADPTEEVRSRLSGAAKAQS